MKRHNLLRLLMHRQLHVVERDCDSPTATLRSTTAHGMIHQDLPHGRASDSNKMTTVLKRSVFSARQLDKCLVDQSRGLESVALILPVPRAPRDAMKLVIDERHQFVERVLVALAPSGKQAGHLALRIHSDDLSIRHDTQISLAL